MKTGFEDKRIELTSGYPLNFPGMDCIVDECIITSRIEKEL